MLLPVPRLEAAALYKQRIVTQQCHFVRGLLVMSRYPLFALLVLLLMGQWAHSMEVEDPSIADDDDEIHPSVYNQLSGRTRRSKTRFSFSYLRHLQGYGNDYDPDYYDPRAFFYFKRPYRSSRLQVVRLKRASNSRGTRSAPADRLRVIRLRRALNKKADGLKVLRL